MFENKCKGKKWDHINHHLVFDVSLSCKLYAFDALFGVIRVLGIVFDEELHEKISEIHSLDKVKDFGEVFNLMLCEACVSSSMALVAQLHVIPECSEE